MNHGWMNVSTCLHLLSFHASGRGDGSSSSSSSSRGGELLLAVTLPQLSLLVSAHAYYLYITCACILPTRDGFSNSLTCKFIFLSLSFTSRRGGRAPPTQHLLMPAQLHNADRYYHPSPPPNPHPPPPADGWRVKALPTQSVGVCTCILPSTSLDGTCITMNWIPRAFQESVRKVLAGSRDKLSSERLHSIIDSMETVVDSFNERLIMDNRLDQNDHTCQRAGVKYSTHNISNA